MAQSIHGTFSSVTGATLEKRLWQADGAVRGMVQLVHGMAEHIDRYDETAKRLNAAGFTVVGHTHLGHGQGADTQGWFSDENGWDALIADTHALRLQTQVDGVPYFLLGHSMGSFVARTYCLTHEDGLSGAIFSGTGHFSRGIVTAGTLIAKLQCALGMQKKPAKLLHAMNFSANNKRFGEPRTEADWLTRDENEVDKYIADPLCGFVFTVQGYRDLFDGLRRLYPECLSAMRKDIPLLLFSGERDPVGDDGKGVTQVAVELRAAGVKDVTLKLYQDGRHEMFNELNRAEVVSDLIQWLDAHIA